MSMFHYHNSNLKFRFFQNVCLVCIYKTLIFIENQGREVTLSNYLIQMAPFIGILYASLFAIACLVGYFLLCAFGNVNSLSLAFEIVNIMSKDKTTCLNERSPSHIYCQCVLSCLCSKVIPLTCWELFRPLATLCCLKSNPHDLGIHFLDKYTNIDQMDVHHTIVPCILF